MCGTKLSIVFLKRYIHVLDACVCVWWMSSMVLLFWKSCRCHYDKPPASAYAHAPQSPVTVFLLGNASYFLQMNFKLLNYTDGWEKIGKKREWVSGGSERASAQAKSKRKKIHRQQQQQQPPHSTTQHSTQHTHTHTKCSLSSPKCDKDQCLRWCIYK